jgi:hypothetical protein
MPQLRRAKSKDLLHARCQVQRQVLQLAADGGMSSMTPLPSAASK